MSDGLNASVDLADGHVDVSASDMSIPARGPDLSLSHTWDSVRALNGDATTAGQGWDTDLSPSMGGALTQTVAYTDAAGTVWSFPYTSYITDTAPYTAYRIPPGQPWALSTSPITGYTLANILTGEVMTFDAQGHLQATTDAYGNRNALTAGTNQPTSETNSNVNDGTTGRALAVTYNGSGQLADAQSPLWQSQGASAAGSQHVTYGYNPQGQLTTLMRGAGTTDALTATFGYNGAELVTVTTPYTQSQHTWQLGYDPQGRVTSVTSPGQGQPGQAGYTPSYTTQFTYGVSQTVVAEGVGTSGALTRTYTLDAQGNATQRIDGLGDTSSTTYDTDHDALTSTDANGHTTSNYYQYVGPTGSTGLITETDTAPAPYYAPGNVPNPNVTHYHYDAANNLIETNKPAGGMDRYAYNAQHSVITTTLFIGYAGNSCPGGQASVRATTSATIQPNGLPQCSYVWQPSVTRYDQYGERVATIDGRGLDVTADAAGTVSLADPATVAAYTRAYTYTAQGDLLAESTPPITVTLPDGQVQANTPVTTTDGYDLDGNRTSLASANGVASGNPAAYTTAYAYDHLGRQVRTTQPRVTLYDGSVATPTDYTAYDGDGNAVSQWDANGNVSTSSYDPLGRLIATMDPVSGTTIITYSATERSATQDMQGNVTRDAYDQAGRLIEEDDPLTGTVQYAYDPVGNTTALTTTDRGTGAIVQWEARQYDAQERIVTDTVGGPVGPTLRTVTGYDQDGNVAQVTQADGDATATDYDFLDRIKNTLVETTTASAPPQSGGETYTYDPASGNLVTADDFDGRVHNVTYDADNREVQSTDYYSFTATLTTATGYDPNGNTVSQQLQGQGPPQTFAATYDANDRETSEMRDGLSTRYGYDLAGRERTRTIADGTAPMTTTLDAEGRATAIVENLDGTGPYTSNFGYNLNDLPITMSVPGGMTETIGYDPYSRLIHIGSSGPPTGAVTSTLGSSYDYGYNAAGWTTALTATINGAATPMQYAHDSRGRLTAWAGQLNGPESWGYDGNGNIVTNTEFIEGQQRATVYTYTSSLPNEIQQQHTDGLGVEYFRYDQQGDTTGITSTDPLTSAYGVSTSLQYDSQARPLTVTVNDRGTPASVMMGYNAAGQRNRYTVMQNGITTFDERFTYRGDELGQAAVVSATAGGGTSSYTDTYLYNADGHPLELLRQQSGTVSRYWYVLDGRNNVVALTSITGTVVDRYAYDPWGEGLPEGTWETVPQPLRYASYWWDKELGWYWVSVRSYDPEGRWLQPDPSEQDGVRTYAYASDDPIDLSDFSGLADDCSEAGEGYCVDETTGEIISVAEANERKLSGMRARNAERVAARIIADTQWEIPGSRGRRVTIGSIEGIEPSELDAQGRPTGVLARLTNGMLRTGSKASSRIIPKGYVSARIYKSWLMARVHLIGNLLGGSGKDPRNLIAGYQSAFNSPSMFRFERQIADELTIHPNAAVYVRVVAHTATAQDRPFTLEMEAISSSGQLYFHVLIENSSAGRVTRLDGLPNNW